jgi:hypothetical protein
LEKNVLEKVENVNEQTKETKENIKNLMNEIFGSAPKIVEQKNENKIVSNLEKNNEEKSEKNDEAKSDLQKENLQENENKTETNDNNLNEEKDLLDLLSDENFAKDFGISETENIEKKEESTNNQNQNKMEEVLSFLLWEIERNNYSPEPEIEEKIKENLFKNINEVFYYPISKKYYILFREILKNILLIENVSDYDEKVLNKKFEKFLKTKKEKQAYKMFSEFIKNFKLFDSVIFTNDNKILVGLSLDNFIILEEIKKNNINLTPLKSNKIKTL